jgi:hypothetical protein
MLVGHHAHDLHRLRRTGAAGVSEAASNRIAIGQHAPDECLIHHDDVAVWFEIVAAKRPTRQDRRA